jgi:hypothetical protein
MLRGCFFAPGHPVSASYLSDGSAPMGTSGVQISNVVARRQLLMLFYNDNWL